MKISRSRSSVTAGCVSDSSPGSGSSWACNAWSCSRIARFSRRVCSRRSRSIALFRATRVIHAPGFAGTPSLGQRWRATTNASWTASSAASKSPRMRMRVATVRPDSCRNRRSTTPTAPSASQLGCCWSVRSRGRRPTRTSVVARHGGHTRSGRRGAGRSGPARTRAQQQEPSDHVRRRAPPPQADHRATNRIGDQRQRPKRMPMSKGQHLRYPRSQGHYRRRRYSAPSTCVRVAQDAGGGSCFLPNQELVRIPRSRAAGCRPRPGSSAGKPRRVRVSATQTSSGVRHTSNNRCINTIRPRAHE